MDLLVNQFWALTITGLAIGAVYALVALGYTLVYGVLRLINFAHSEVFMWGSFAAVWVLMGVGATNASGMGVVGLLVLGFAAAMAASGLIAIGLEFFAYTITGLTIGAVYALVALGYTLVYGVLRLINFAHSEVFMYGTFAALWVTMLLGGRGQRPRRRLGRAPAPRRRRTGRPRRFP